MTEKPNLTAELDFARSLANEAAALAQEALPQRDAR